MKCIPLAAAILLTAGLAACASGPAIDAVRTDLPVAQLVTLRSQSDTPLEVRRAIANDRANDAACDRPVNTRLAPHAETTVLFIGCGKVRSLRVETNMGDKSFDWKVQN